jgi:hypothetical protein
LCFGAATVLVIVGLALPLGLLDWYPAGILLFAVLLVGIVLIRRPSTAHLGAPLVGVVLGWFAIAPILNLFAPPFDQQTPTATEVAWSWLVAGLLLLGILRTPWSQWRSGGNRA